MLEIFCHIISLDELMVAVQRSVRFHPDRPWWYWYASIHLVL